MRGGSAAMRTRGHREPVGHQRHAPSDLRRVPPVV